MSIPKSQCSECQKIFLNIYEVDNCNKCHDSALEALIASELKASLYLQSEAAKAVLFERCPSCSNPFKPWYMDQIFCSVACEREHYD